MYNLLAGAFRDWVRVVSATAFENGLQANTWTHMWLTLIAEAIRHRCVDPGPEALNAAEMEVQKGPKQMFEDRRPLLPQSTLANRRWSVLEAFVALSARRSCGFVIVLHPTGSEVLLALKDK